MNRFVLVFAIVFSFSAFSQLAPTRNLWRGLNRVNSSNIRPVLSGDGKYMVYLTNIDQGDNLMKMWYSKKGGGESWTDQELVDIKTINKANSNLLGAYFITYDGKRMLYTSRKSGGVGKYDIWESKRSGDTWRAPTNLGKPLNTDSNDGFPSLSPDGKTIYFSRCPVMTENKCEGCKIMMAERGKIFVKKAVELPSYINTGNSIAPLILADNKTLVYSSNKNGGKGGYDLFLTRFENGKWSKPLALDYINSPSDEKYISIPAKGDIAYFSKKVKEVHTLVKAKIPPKYRQRNILWLEGKITAPNLANVKVQIVNLNTKEKLTLTPNAKGEFLVLPTAGAKYDISIRDTEGKYTFESRIDDLTNNKRNTREKWNVTLQPIAGATINVKGIPFKPYSSTLTKEVKNELDRVIFVMKKNATLKLRGGVHLKELKTGEQKTADLSEEKREMVVVQKEVEVIDSVMQDTVIVTPVSVNGIIEDSTWVGKIKVAVKSTQMVDEEVEKITYNNDRTMKQAEAVKAYLVSKGISSSRIMLKGHGDRQNKFREEDSRDIKIEVKF